jgi:hypothetical protein
MESNVNIVSGFDDSIRIFLTETTNGCVENTVPLGTLFGVIT